jgi:ABC-type branched-subunit amino acid transport system ATPase component
LVGAEEDMGLSFEQKKRLSIAVELAASPSIIFLDEVRRELNLLCERESKVSNSSLSIVFCRFTASQQLD